MFHLPKKKSRPEGVQIQKKFEELKDTQANRGGAEILS